MHRVRRLPSEHKLRFHPISIRIVRPCRARFHQQEQCAHALERHIHGQSSLAGRHQTTGKEFSFVPHHAKDGTALPPGPVVQTHLGSKASDASVQGHAHHTFSMCAQPHGIDLTRNGQGPAMNRPIRLRRTVILLHLEKVQAGQLDHVFFGLAH